MYSQVRWGSNFHACNAACISAKISQKYAFCNSPLCRVSGSTQRSKPPLPRLMTLIFHATTQESVAVPRVQVRE